MPTLRMVRWRLTQWAFKGPPKAEPSAGRRSISNARLRREHAALRAALSQTGVLLAQAVEQADDSEPHGRAPRRARRALADLARRFPAHFAREEAIGYLAEALEVAPRFHPRVEALQAQHVEFALEIDRLARLARAAGGAVRSWRVVDRDFATFAEVLIAHEEAENEIMGSAFLDDIGTCD